MHRKRKRNRLKEYNYSQGGYYFVTICVNDRENIFGTVENNKCILNKYGSIVEMCLKEIKKRYSYIELDYYVIMPNHVHVIIIIDPSKNNYVVTDRDLSQNKHKIKIKKQKVKSLSEIIGAFKTMSSKEIHLKGYKHFKWQRSFYDRIIRNENELFLIRKYIEENPLRLEIAKEFPDNIDL